VKKISFVLLFISAYAVAMEDAGVPVKGATEDVPFYAALWRDGLGFFRKEENASLTAAKEKADASATITAKGVEHKAALDVTTKEAKINEAKANTFAALKHQQRVQEEALKQTAPVAPTVKVEDVETKTLVKRAVEKTVKKTQATVKAIKDAGKTCIDKCLKSIANNQAIIAYAVVGAGVPTGIWLYQNGEEEAGIAVGSVSVAAGLIIHPTSRGFILNAVKAVQKTLVATGKATKEYIKQHPVVVGVTVSGVVLVAVGAAVYAVVQNEQKTEVVVVIPA
jgi:hypothetical protein